MKIVSSYKFEGNILERNICRRREIELLKNSEELQNIVYELQEAYEHKDYYKLKCVFLNKLFFEELDDRIFKIYLNKLFKHKKELDVFEFFNVYNRYSTRSFVYTVDKLIKQ